MGGFYRKGIDHGTSECRTGSGTGMRTPGTGNTPGNGDGDREPGRGRGRSTLANKQAMTKETRAHNAFCSLQLSPACGRDGGGGVVHLRPLYRLLGAYIRHVSTQRYAAAARVRSAQHDVLVVHFSAQPEPLVLLKPPETTQRIPHEVVTLCLNDECSPYRLRIQRFLRRIILLQRGETRAADAVPGE